MKPQTNPSIAALVARLEQTPLDGLSLVRSLNEVDLDVDALLKLAAFEYDRYVRVSLYRTAAFEVRLLCWRPGQSSALHPHGTSCCAFRVLTGRARETRIGREDRVLERGSVGLADPDGVHQVANMGEEALVTLHLYAPPLPVERPTSEEGHRVVIIGGGFSGVAVAMHLLQSGCPELRVTIVERGPWLGRGLAYGAADEAHLLNVPAASMSVDPAVPDEFVRYAHQRGISAAPRSLLPRRLYGDYLVDRLARLVKAAPGRLRVVSGEAGAVVARGDGRYAVSVGGRIVLADDVVLATGHAEPLVPPGLRSLARDEALVVDPWSPAALASVAPESDVLIVGTGLTALDIVGALMRRGHRGAIHATSTNGRWPREHLPTVMWTGAAVVLDPASAPATADGLARWLQGACAAARDDGKPWQAVLEAVRPHVASLWKRLPVAEREVFLRVHRSRWEIHRHRAPADLLAQLGAWEAAGVVRSHRGAVASAARRGARVEVVLGDGDALTVDRVLLCTGAASDYRNTASAPWPDLVASGFVTPDPNGLGVVTEENCSIVGRGGPGLWAIGGLLRSRWFEVTAVPDLARRAVVIADAIIARRSPLARDGNPVTVGARAS